MSLPAKYPGLLGAGESGQKAGFLGGEIGGLVLL